MKFNWGTGIFLFYTTFAVAMIGAVIKSTTFDNSLVVEDYYAKDITYQSTLERKARSQALNQPLTLELLEGDYELVFPLAELRGTPRGQVQFYRTNSSKFDEYYSLEVDRYGHMKLPTTGRLTGLWRVIVEWEDDKQEYLDEFTLYLTAS